MDFSCPDGEIHSLENGKVANQGMEIPDLEQDRSFSADHGVAVGGKKEVGGAEGERAAALSDGSFQLQGQQFVGLSREFHGELVEHIAAETADHHGNGFFKPDAAALQIKELIF